MEEWMRLCAVNGSFRGTRGASYRIIQAIQEGFTHTGGTVEILNLSEKNIKNCLGCNRCQISKTYKCIYESTDEIASMFQIIRDADVVLYITPVYVFGISSLLKKFLERFYSVSPVDELLITDSGIVFHTTDNKLMKKPFVSIIVCDNIEDITVQNSRGFFRNFTRFLDASHIGHIERRSASVWLSLLKESHQKKGIMAKRILDSFIKMGEELGNGKVISRRTKHIAEQKLIHVPVMVKAAWKIPILRPMIKGEMNRISKTYYNT
jgi:multimeric flavodoxin WrbA